MKYQLEKLNDEKLEVIQKCIDYLLDSEETHYEESSRKDKKGHIYEYALMASKIKWEIV